MTAAASGEEKLPPRDWILLPLVSLATVVALFAASELVARGWFSEHGRFNCDVRGADGLVRGKPDCVSYAKNAEGPTVEYRFNQCGYRSTKPCGAKPAGNLRIALLGTSIAMGLYVPYEETFAARTERGLEQACRRRVEVQNMGSWGLSLNTMPALAAEALRLQPDGVVLAIAPYDLKIAEAGARPAGPAPPPAAGRIDAFLRGCRVGLRDSRAALVAQHFMLQDEQFLYRAYRWYGDNEGAQQAPRDAEGGRGVAILDHAVATLAARLHASGVPFIVLAVPNRIAAALASNHARLDGIDPYSFGRRAGEVATRAGALYIDTTAEFARVPHAERLFYPIDNHPMGTGHAVIAQALIHYLTTSSEPSLAAFRTAGVDR